MTVFFHGLYERCLSVLVFRLTHLVTLHGGSIGYEFIPSHSEIFRFIPISVSEPMRIIPNESEKRFVSRLMKNGKKSIRPNPI